MRRSCCRSIEGHDRARRLDAERAGLRWSVPSVDLWRANVDGVFTVPGRPICWAVLSRANSLFVVGEVRPLARVVVPQDAIDKVRLSTKRVQVRLVDRPEAVFEEPAAQFRRKRLSARRSVGG